MKNKSIAGVLASFLVIIGLMGVAPSAHASSCTGDYELTTTKWKVNRTGGTCSLLRAKVTGRSTTGQLVVSVGGWVSDSTWSEANRLYSPISDISYTSEYI